MKVEKCTTESFIVIGKESSTEEEQEFSEGLYLAGVESKEMDIFP